MNLPKFLTSSPVSPVMASSCHSSVLQWTAAAPPVAPPAPRSGTATAAAPRRSRTPCRGSPLRRSPGGRSPGRRAARCARGGCGGAGCARLHLSFEDLVCCVVGGVSCPKLIPIDKAIETQPSEGMWRLYFKSTQDCMHEMYWNVVFP